MNAAFNPQDYRPQDIDACYGLQADGLYHLSPVQADKILQMALQKLTGLEQDKINDEYRQANAQITDLLDILARPERVVKIMDDELAELKDKFGDDRRSEIDPSGDPNFNPLDFVPEETMVVTLSREGYIKRQSLTEYRSQRRGGQARPLPNSRKATRSTVSSRQAVTIRPCASAISDVSTLCRSTRSRRARARVRVRRSSICLTSPKANRS